MMKKSIPFAHLHVHSHYSFLDGLASPSELVHRAVDHGMDVLALTDLHSLSGAIEFYDACQEAGIKPILGLEVRHTPPADFPGALTGHPPAHLTLLAKNMSGWSSLCRLASAVDHERGVLPFEALRQHTRGLICTSGGRRSTADRLLENGQDARLHAWLEILAKMYPDSLYAELQIAVPYDHTRAASFHRLACELNIPAVATNPVYYIDLEQARLQEVAVAIRMNSPLGRLPSEEIAPPNSHFLSAEEMEVRFADFPEALTASAEIAERCRLELPLGQPRFPEIDLSGDDTSDDILRRKAERGATSLYDPLPEHVRARLEYELEVIHRCGYAPLFLIMQEIMNFARHKGVPTASRGSAASSLVAHCLGITDPDPIRLDLYFERFLNPARHTPPDIDTDLCSKRRDEVIHFVYERFGEDRVAMVCTIMRFRRRSALREVAKAYGLPASEISAMVDRLPGWWYGPRSAEDDAHPYADLREHYDSPTHQNIFRDAAALIGTPHHLSVHPGGMVIAPGPIQDLAATQLAPKGVVITQFDHEAIERLGLVKIDLLGIRGLSVLGDVAAALLKRQPTKKAGSSSLSVLDAIPEHDEATCETVRNGRTIGCFQIESPGMRATLRAVDAQCIDDIMIALALYRPGPLTGGLWDAFVRRHRKEEAPAYLHPALQPLLSDTYGVILYQEQVLRTAHELAGLSLADADLLRRAMSHFDPGERMRTLKEKFVEGANRRSGVPIQTGEQIWELMAAFAGYGFPKAHAASYAQIGWRAAWCKTHHPALFMTAVLANWGGYYPQRVYLTEARRMGLSLHSPHINYAHRHFSLHYIDGEPVLFMGLDQVKNLTRRTQNRIMRLRPFSSLDDFLMRVDPRSVEAENLVKTGALDGLGTIPDLLTRLKQGAWRGGQMSLFELEDRNSAEDWNLEQKVRAEEELLGASLTAHPLELASQAIADAGALTTLEAIGRLGQRICVAGMRQTWRRSRAAHGERIYVLSLDDLEGTLEVIIPARVYHNARAAFAEHGPYLIEGTLQTHRERGEPFLRAERVALL